MQCRSCIRSGLQHGCPPHHPPDHSGPGPVDAVGHRLALARVPAHAPADRKNHPRRCDLGIGPSHRQSRRAKISQTGTGTGGATLAFVRSDSQAVFDTRVHCDPTVLCHHRHLGLELAISLRAVAECPDRDTRRRRGRVAAEPERQRQHGTGSMNLFYKIPISGWPNTVGTDVVTSHRRTGGRASGTRRRRSRATLRTRARSRMRDRVLVCPPGSTRVGGNRRRYRAEGRAHRPRTRTREPAWKVYSSRGVLQRSRPSRTPAARD